MRKLQSINRKLSGFSHEKYQGTELYKVSMERELQKIKVKRLTEFAKLPVKATKGSAGWDLYAALQSKVLIKPGEVKKIPTGLAIEITSSKYVGLVFARSGLSVSFKISLVNAVGVIDSDYRGELLIPLCNYSQKDYAIEPNDRIAQLIIMPVVNCEFEEVETLSETRRGVGGFGSTGKN